MCFISFALKYKKIVLKKDKIVTGDITGVEMKNSEI